MLRVSQSQYIADNSEIVQPAKRFKHLELVLDNQDKESDKPVSHSKEEMDIERYLQSTPRSDRVLDEYSALLSIPVPCCL